MVGDASLGIREYVPVQISIPTKSGFFCWISVIVVVFSFFCSPHQQFAHPFTMLGTVRVL
jgi:hypothetical protein